MLFLRLALVFVCSCSFLRVYVALFLTLVTCFLVLFAWDWLHVFPYLSPDTNFRVEFWLVCCVILHMKDTWKMLVDSLLNVLLLFSSKIRNFTRPFPVLMKSRFMVSLCRLKCNTCRSLIISNYTRDGGPFWSKKYILHVSCKTQAINVQQPEAFVNLILVLERKKHRMERALQN